MILTGQSIYGIISIIQGHLQGQMVDLKVKRKNVFFNKYKYQQVYYRFGVILTLDNQFLKQF